MSTNEAQPPSSNERVDRVLAALRKYAEAAQNLPQGDDYKYNKAFRGFPKAMKHHGDALTEAMNKVAACNFGGKRAIDFAAITSIPARHIAAMEAVDSLHETVDHLLDEVRGDKLRAADQLAVGFGSTTGMVGAPGTNADFATRFSRHLRPQAQFVEPVDNSTAPFAPIIVDPATGQRRRGTVGVHPFQEALDTLSFQPHQLVAGGETLHRPLDETPLVCVDTVEALDAMVAELKQCREIAIDLEHHNFHSYLGFTCLAQISSREKDYIVDTLTLRSHMWRLNAVLTDASIVKVFHAAHEDIRWLQKDFGCYVVNMFDTGIALQSMHMPHSLAFLVDHFCQVKLDKTYQTADWRVRPLPPALVNYARQDTHYLLYCYDRLRAVLLSASAVSRHESHASLATGNLLVHVLHESRRRCAVLYTKDAFDEETTWAVSLGKSLGGLNPVQRAVAKAVFNWRDSVARADDESAPAVLHTASVLTLATRLPRSARDVIRLAQPATVALRRDAAKLATLICSLSGEDADVAASAADAENRVAGDEAVAPGAWHAPQVHRPMTGTLPSVAHAFRRVDKSAPQAQLQALPDNATPPSDDVLRRFLLSAKTTTVPFARTMEGIALAVPVPGVQRLKVVAPAAPAVRSKRVDSDDDDAPAAADAAVPDAETAADEAIAEEAEDTAAPDAKRHRAEDGTLPPSLKEQFGGLGREDRRRAQRTKAKK